jgi:hypothetical protein
MSHSLRALGIIVAVGLPIGLYARTPAPACEGLSARDCLTLALDAASSALCTPWKDVLTLLDARSS